MIKMIQRIGIYIKNYPIIKNCTSKVAFDKTILTKPFKMYAAYRHDWSRHIGKQTACIGENKGTVNCAVTAQLISTFVFDTQIVQFLLYLYTKFQVLACSCDCTGWFVSDPVGNPDCWFSNAKAHFMIF